MVNLGPYKTSLNTVWLPLSSHRVKGFTRKADWNTKLTKNVFKTTLELGIWFGPPVLKATAPSTAPYHNLFSLFEIS